MIILIANTHILAIDRLTTARTDLLVLSLIARTADKLAVNLHVLASDALPALSAHKALGVVILATAQRDRGPTQRLPACSTAVLLLLRLFLLGLFLRCCCCRCCRSGVLRCTALVAELGAVRELGRALDALVGASGRSGSSSLLGFFLLGLLLSGSGRLGGSGGSSSGLLGLFLSGSRRLGGSCRSSSSSFLRLLLLGLLLRTGFDHEGFLGFGSLECSLEFFFVL